MEAATTCPSCQQENPSGALRCSRCGQALGGEALAIQDPPERTAKTRNPTAKRGLLRRLKHWWNKRRRRAD